VTRVTFDGSLTVQEFSPKRRIEEQARLSGNIKVEDCRTAVRVAASKEPITALVGFREWIFSGKVLKHQTLLLEKAAEMPSGNCVLQAKVVNNF
jgi:hypothetical protein